MGYPHNVLHAKLVQKSLLYIVLNISLILFYYAHYRHIKSDVELLIELHVFYWQLVQLNIFRSSYVFLYMLWELYQRTVYNLASSVES